MIELVALWKRLDVNMHVATVIPAGLCRLAWLSEVINLNTVRRNLGNVLFFHSGAGDKGQRRHESQELREHAIYVPGTGLTVSVFTVMLVMFAVAAPRFRVR